MAYLEKPNENKSLDTGQMELLSRTHVDLDELRKPWRCSYCDLLVYSLKDGYPVKGAPQPRYYTVSYPSLCALCRGLVDNGRFCLAYWTDLHQEWKRDQEKRKDKKDGLTGRKDYFTS